MVSEKINSTAVENEQKPEMTREELARTIVDGFTETYSETLSDIRDRIRAHDREPEADEFSFSTPYLDKEGNVVAVSYELEHEELPAHDRTLYSDRSEEQEKPQVVDKKCRVLVGGETIVATIPVEFQGTGLTEETSRSGKRDVYILPDDLPEDVVLPEDIQKLVDIFGKSLSETYDENGGGLYASGRLTGVRVEEVFAEVDSRRDTAYDEALIEDAEREENNS